ncbi:helix-turn-helix domain-containing protein [Rhodococcus sp. W8901]|uniref:helix-turn-helix domain-containing protein n=1 Tax=Rhodococcus sp. W8901 TaxID=2742603 RepID=UPI0034A0D024
MTDAATELFVERGFDQVGVHDIAERAGCSRAALYRYVGGKPALVAAVRADATLSYWFAHTRTGDADDYLASSPDLSRVATALTGIAPDEAGGQWVVRVVLTLLAWPAADTRMERQMVQRFVAPAFDT